MSSKLKTFAKETVQNITQKATRNVAKTQFFKNLKLDLTIFVNMHSSCNINDVGKPELFEEPFIHTKYPIKLSYNAAKPGITSFFNQNLLGITNRKELKKEASLQGIFKKDIEKNYNEALTQYNYYKEKSDFLNPLINNILELYFYDVYDKENQIFYYKNQIKNENQDKYILVNDDSFYSIYYLINNNLTINKLNEIIREINKSIQYIIDNDIFQPLGKTPLIILNSISEINNDIYVKIANVIYILNVTIKNITKDAAEYEQKKNYFNSLLNNINPSNKDIVNYFGYINNLQMKYYNEPQFNRINRLYKQTYSGSVPEDKFIGGLYITFKFSNKLLKAISYFLSDNKNIGNSYLNENNPAKQFFEKNFNNILLNTKTSHQYLFLGYLFKIQNMTNSEIVKIISPVFKNFNNTNNILTSSDFKTFIEAIANNIGKCTVFNVVCLSFNNNEEIDSNTNTLLNEQLKSVIIPSNEASPESSESKKSGGRKTKKHRKYSLLF